MSYHVLYTELTRRGWLSSHLSHQREGEETQHLETCLVYMIVAGKPVLFEFRKEHSPSRKALDAWLKIVEETEFDGFNDLRKTFPSADLVHHIYTIFNIAGIKYRLVTKINYGETKVVLIRAIWTHAEYDKKTNREKLKAGRV